MALRLDRYWSPAAEIWCAGPSPEMSHRSASFSRLRHVASSAAGSRDDFRAKQLIRNARRWRQHELTTSANSCVRLSREWHRCQRHATHMRFERAGSQYVSVRAAGWPGTVAMSQALGGLPRAAHAEQAVTKESDRALRRSRAAAIPGESSPGGHGRSAGLNATI